MRCFAADAELIVRDIRDALEDVQDNLAELREWAEADEGDEFMANIKDLAYDIRLSLDDLDWWIIRRQRELAHADQDDE